MMRQRRRRNVERVTPDLEEDRGFEDAFQSVGEVLPEVLKKLRLEDRLTLHQIEQTWSNLVGPSVARQARPARLVRSALVIQVLQPSVRYFLETRRTALLQHFQARFGAERIGAIRFVVS
ncbi:MAG TPA: DUF721 domain-containing protein [Verrucomicrobiales bacterium]|nr:DUF721 domain-containing protein [Verrucomicrobiales bacterium]